MSIADNSPPTQPHTADRLAPTHPGARQAAARAPGGGPTGPIGRPLSWNMSLPTSAAPWRTGFIGPRGGASTPHTASGARSRRALQQRLQWASAPETRQFLQSVLDVLQAHKDEALTYAQYVLEYEQLPYVENGRRSRAAVPSAT